MVDPTVLLKNNENEKGQPVMGNNISQHRIFCSSKNLKKFAGSSSKDRFDGLSSFRERFLKEGLSSQSTNIIMVLWQNTKSIKYQI